MSSHKKGPWKKEMASLVVPSGAKQAGFQSKLGITRSSARSYGMQREAQLMRQMSTRLFLHAADAAKRKGKEGPVEVEMMYSGGNLFIGTNRNVTARTIYKTLSYRESTREALVEKSYFSTSKSIGGRIEKRHTRKLEERVFDKSARQSWRSAPGLSKGEIQSRKRTGELARMVRRVEPEILDLGSSKGIRDAFSGTGGVYILHGGEEGRHVEEKFMDVLETAGHQGRSIVAGKMRPCLTCSGRMEHMKHSGHDIQFNPHPGKVWISRFEDQPGKVRSHTIRLAQTKHTYRSSTGWGYGSDSDSD